jgi:beta-N-acetylhexosaminidase
MYSLADDVGQLLWIGFEGTEVTPALAAQLGAGAYGAVVLFKRNLRAAADGGTDVAALIELNRALHAAAPAGDLLICVDQEGGTVQRVRAPATVWPAMIAHDAQPAGDDAILAEQVGLALGLELAAMGFDVDFAPVLDVHTNDANPVIGDRAFARDADSVALLAGRFADGLAAARVLSCGKHFPGHGDTQLDSHLALPRVDHPLERLRRVELSPFARLTSLPTLMTAHVVFAAVDAERPATLSPRVLGDILRGELGYQGVVVSDDLEMKAIADHYGVEDAVVRGLLAGCDAFLLCHQVELQRRAFTELLRQAERDTRVRARVVEASARIRALKQRHFASRRAVDMKVIGCAEHQALARELGAAIDDTNAWTI